MTGTLAPVGQTPQVSWTAEFQTAVPERVATPRVAPVRVPRYTGVMLLAKTATASLSWETSDALCSLSSIYFKGAE